MSYTVILLMVWVLALYATDANRDAKMSRFAGPDLNASKYGPNWWARHKAKWYNQIVTTLPPLVLIGMGLYGTMPVWHVGAWVLGTLVADFVVWRISVRYWGGVKWGSFVIDWVKGLFD